MMGFPFYIARRYIFSKKSHHAINVISGISVCGVAIATTALVCILSVFNGFQDMISGLFTAFDPQIKVVPAEGKYMDASHPKLIELGKNEDIAVYTNVVEDNAMAMLYNRQAVVTVKGVDDNYRELVDVESILCGDGEYVLNYDILDFGIFGIGVLHNHFGVDIWYDTPVKMYAPRKGERIDLNDPLESFNEGELFCPNVSFESKQGKYDSNYVITSLDFAQKLFEKEGRVTSVELKIAEGVDIDDAEEKIQAQLGDDFIVKNRYEQQEDTFRIMEIEKLISYIFLTFVLVVASFNIISSLSMLIIDKKQDIKTLRNLGASDSQIATIFMIEGRMISLIGAVIGIVLGLSLCLLQQYFGFVKLGSSSESYIIEAYPVKVEILDILVTFVTVLVIGFISVWYPVKRLSKR
jgi:lipoprotein-releasing system permease protein